MDTRSLLARLPFEDRAPSPGNELRALVDVLSWITEARTRSGMRVSTARLAPLVDWEFTGRRTGHRTGRHFDVIETGWLPEPPVFRRLTPGQFKELTRHSHYLNMQARSALACSRSLIHGGDL